MQIITQPIEMIQLKIMAKEKFGDMIKAVVDVEKEIMVIGGELHADEEALLLTNGSNQADLWGINIYVDLKFPEAVEFDSMINIRPSQENRSRGVDNSKTREKILKIVKNLINYD